MAIVLGWKRDTLCITCLFCIWGKIRVVKGGKGNHVCTVLSAVCGKNGRWIIRVWGIVKGLYLQGSGRWEKKGVQVDSIMCMLLMWGKKKVGREGSVNSFLVGGLGIGEWVKGGVKMGMGWYFVWEGEHGFRVNRNVIPLL